MNIAKEQNNELGNQVGEYSRKALGKGKKMKK